MHIDVRYSWAWWHMSLRPVFRTQRQVGFCELEASLDCIESSRPSRGYIVSPTVKKQEGGNGRE